MKKDSKENVPKLAFTAKNYIYMLISAALVVLGFIFMSGGGSNSPDEFNEAMFSFRRITLSVIFVLAGFSLMVFAIMKRFEK